MKTQILRILIAASLPITSFARPQTQPDKDIRIDIPQTFATFFTRSPGTPEGCYAFHFLAPDTALYIFSLKRFMNALDVRSSYFYQAPQQVPSESYRFKITRQYPAEANVSFPDLDVGSTDPRVVNIHTLHTQGQEGLTLQETAMLANLGQASKITFNHYAQCPTTP